MPLRRQPVRFEASFLPPPLDGILKSLSIGEISLRFKTCESEKNLSGVGGRRRRTTSIVLVLRKGRKSQREEEGIDICQGGAEEEELLFVLFA